MHFAETATKMRSSGKCFFHLLLPKSRMKFLSSAYVKVSLTGAMLNNDRAVFHSCGPAAMLSNPIRSDVKNEHCIANDCLSIVSSREFDPFSSIPSSDSPRSSRLGT